MWSPKGFVLYTHTHAYTQTHINACFFLLNAQAIDDLYLLGTLTRKLNERGFAALGLGLLIKRRFD